MYLLIDVGGTKTRITVTKDKDSFETPVVFLTPQDFSTWLATLDKEFATLHISKKDLKGIIVGIPGTFTTQGEIIKTPNLSLWQGTPLSHHLEKLFSVRTHVYNDAALVGLGEAVHGAGKGQPIVAYITISTGVGGTRIVNGKLDANMFGFEIGHTIIDMKTEQDVESFISGGALERAFGKPSHEVQDIALWEKISRYAGIFVANTTMYWSPAIIVLGGPVMNDLHIDIIEKEAKKHLFMYKEYPILTRGTLKDYGGLYGALAISSTL